MASIATYRAVIPPRSTEVLPAFVAVNVPDVFSSDQPPLEKS